MRRPVSFITGALLLFIIGGVPTRSFSQDLPSFPAATETGTAIHDGPWQQLFVPGQPFAAETPATATVAEADPPSQPAAPRPAEPQHTGFAALIRTVGSDFVALPKRRSTWVFVGIGAGGALLAHPADDNVNARLVGSPAVGRFFAPGKIIGAAWVQTGVSVGLYVVGRYVLPHTEGEGKTNKVSHLGYDLLRAQILSQALVQGIKITARRDRPTGECCSFPSGHAATAFAVASVLERHLGYRAAWPTLAAAAYVGASRLHDNRHFLSDVVFGSAIGMATGWTIVGRHGRSDYALLPVPVRGGFALNLTRAPQHGD
jgi:PAP2 superfamily protein